MKDSQPLNYVFKVLSGPLNGIEFLLNGYDYFICVGQTSEMPDEVTSSLSVNERSFYLPGSGICHNFTLQLKATLEDAASFSIVLHDITHQETISREFNTVCYVGGVYFALKPENEAWSEAVLKGVPTHVEPLAEKVLIEAPIEKKAKKGQKGSWRTKWGHHGLLALVLTLLCFGSAAAWFTYRTETTITSGPRILTELMDQHAGYSVQLGRDKVFYVFAQNIQQANWAKQAIARSDSEEVWKVVTPEEEEARLGQVLDRLKVPFFVIRLSDPRTPTLVMSHQNNKTDKEAVDRLNKALLDALPYAHNINIEWRNNQEVVRLAEEGLSALGLEYKLEKSDQSVTLVTNVGAADTRLAEFSRFADQFYQNWGRRYVHFTVELKDESAKEKSYKYGKDGYVSMGKSHWVFE